jgi:hypothetical protein
MERKTQFSIGYFLLVFFALLLLQNYFFMRHVQDISYSEFRKLVQEGKVDDLVISSNIIRGKMREGASDIISAMRGDPSLKEHFGKMKEEGHSFSTVRMEDAELVKVEFSIRLNWRIPGSKRSSHGLSLCSSSSEFGVFSLKGWVPGLGVVS